MSSTKPPINFKQFDSLYNTEGDRCYVALHGKKPIHKWKDGQGKTFKEIIAIAKTDPKLRIGWIPPQGYSVVDIDDTDTAKIIYKIIKDRKEKVLINRTRKGLHVVGKYKTDKNSATMCSVIGALTDIRAAGKGYIVLPFYNPNVNKDKDLQKERRVLYYGGNGDIPFYLRNTLTKGGAQTYIQFPHTSGSRNDSLVRHLGRITKKRNISKISEEQILETAELINKYVMKPSLAPYELEQLCRDEVTQQIAEDPNPDWYTEKGVFLHNVMGDWLIDKLKICKDKLTNRTLYFNDLKGVYEMDDNHLEYVITMTEPTLRTGQIKEVRNYIGRSLYGDRVEFDANPYQVNFKNGHIDLGDMELQPASEFNHSTIRLNCNYNPQAYSQTVDEFFDTITCGDKDVEQLLYEAIGYAMLKTVDLQKAFLLVGEGRNGKSTYLDLVKEVLGQENTETVDIKDLSNSFRSSNLVDKLASIGSDISNQGLKETDALKKIIGGDRITVERKYEQAYSVELYSTLMFAANDLPRTSDTSDGFYRRWHIIPFNADLTGVTLSDGASFKKRLLSAESCEYVAWRALEAIHRVIASNSSFIEPQCVKDMLRVYRVQNDSTLLWIEREGFTREELKTKSVDQWHEIYKLWCTSATKMPTNELRFEKSLCKEYHLTTERRVTTIKNREVKHFYFIEK